MTSLDEAGLDAILNGDRICPCGHVAKGHVYDLAEEKLDLDYDIGYGCDAPNCTCRLNVVQAIKASLMQYQALEDEPNIHAVNYWVAKAKSYLA